ncbi:farnesyl-diphosphate synthase [Desulfatibacillum alkenivorans DSM 16219]|jgi:geranylgeranyl diphosphate synthase type II|uniref:Farnesyl-diphosphate synthase n=1 Tax=Desulfatibacillum alkenivorans DSM 16219 TaxID=1121393 RepID=A0A1M6VPJ5_9BACT|nr:farnesyl diphosphate synthase [Desulfatibacillum alkenivorans]SHK83452.1 farnesyl-diphosphate synthase [Desulfatibacillum alkenivorans DSM 16219]
MTEPSLQSDLNSFDLKAFLTEYGQLVAAAMEKRIARYPAESRVTQAMRHSLFAGGKRLRPILCMTAAEAVGGDKDLVMDVAAALEFIHTYSLIHDDLPALDDDDYRRGTPTCHKAFDEATAILAGDGLLTSAFEILSHAADDGLLPAEKVLTIIARISHAAGCNGMILGQMLDIEGESKSLTREELESVHNNKTGAMIEVSVFSGAYLGGGTPEQIASLDVYAKNVGLAFQVIDDILNVVGDPKVMGKAVGTDAELGKSTYPALMGLDGARDFAERLINKALQAIVSFDNKCDPLRSIATYILTRSR